MAQTDDGKKFIRVPAHTREQGGETVKVPAHIRSTPKTSDGPGKKK
jgi:hypothetical protein